MYRYRVYGFLLASDMALPGLPPAEPGGAADVEFRTGYLPAGLDIDRVASSDPTYVSPYTDASGEPICRMWSCTRSGLYYFWLVEGLAFAVDFQGAAVWAKWPERMTLSEITAFLLGRILAFIVHLRGGVCLHASAVVLGGRAVLFAGYPGMGKSSTAAALVERGCAALSDDLSVIRKDERGRQMVAPGAPRVCLYPDSIGFVYGPETARKLPRLHPNEEKRVLGLEASAGKFCAEPAPLAAIYLLGPRSSAAAAPWIGEVGGADRLIGLLYNGFMNLALRGGQKAREFQMLGEIARSVRVRTLVPSSDPQKLEQLCELIKADVRAASTSLAGHCAAGS